MDEKGIQKPSNNDDVVISKKVVYKNLLIVGFMQLLSYAAIGPTTALLTTTAGKTLGNITFAFSYIFSCLFSFFTVCMLDKETSKKMVILFGNACIFGFTACNWYVSYYTLIPGTILFGAGASTSWMASLTYTRKLSVNYTKNYNLNEKHTTSLFTGIVVGLSLGGYLLGNATMSGVLMILKPNNNEKNTEVVNNFTDNNDLSECLTNDDELEFNFITMNILRGLIVFYSLLGFIIVLFLDNLEKRSLQGIFQPRVIIFNFIKGIWLNLIPVATVSAKKEMLMSLPLFITSGASLTFVFTRYTKTYVAECVGVHVVGYAIMMYGLGTSLGSFISGKLLSLGTKCLLVLGILVLHLTILIFLAIWEREPNLLVLLFIILLWGFCDGSWMTVCSSFAVACCEEEKTRYSFAVYRIVFLVAIGLSTLFNLVISVEVHLIILCTMFLMFAPLHLMMTSCCSDPHLYIYNEIPIYFVDE